MRELEPSLGRFAFLTRWHSLHLPCRSWIGPFISPDSNHSSRNSTSKKTVSAALSHEHGGLASFSFLDRQAALHWLIRSGRFGWLPFRRHGTREGGNEGGREGGREGRGGDGRGGEGRGGEGRGGDCPHFPQTRTFVTAEPSRPPAKRVTG